MSRRRVLIYLPDPFSARNFLFTPLWDELRSREGVEFGFVSPSRDQGQYIEGHDSDSVWWRRSGGDEPRSLRHALRRLAARPGLSESRAVARLGMERLTARFQRELHFRLLCRFNTVHGFSTHRLKLSLPRSERKRHFGEFRSLGWPFPSSGALMRTLLRIHSSARLPLPAWLSKLIEETNPSLVVIAYPQSRGGFAVARAAARYRIPTVAYINSWDQPTTKGPLPLVDFRHVMVWNRQMKDELVRFHGVEPSHISAVGAPHLDLHHCSSLVMERQEFLNSIGIPEDGRLLVYGTYNRRLGPDEPAVAEHIARAVSSGAYGSDTWLCIRPYPKDVEWQERFGGLAESSRVVVIPSSGYGEPVPGSEPDAQTDLRRFVNLMKHADVVINGPSTLALDAIAFDTPVVHVGFDGDRNLPYKLSIRFRYDFDHYARLMTYGGTRLVESYEDLDGAIQTYLEDPSVDALGRRRVREELLEPFDGRAGSRIAERIDRLARGEF